MKYMKEPFLYSTVYFPIDTSFKIVNFISLSFHTVTDIRRWIFIQVVLLFITIKSVILKLTANAKAEMGGRKGN